MRMTGIIAAAILTFPAACGLQFQIASQASAVAASDGRTASGATVRVAQTPRHWVLQSLDGRMEFKVDTQKDGHLTWSLTRDRQPVIADSPLGIRRADQTFDAGLTTVNTTGVTTIDERYAMPYGKRRDHRVIGREWTLTFANAAGAKIDLIVRMHNDGVAFRYRFPESADGVKTVVEERTGFHVPQGSTAWMMPQQEVHKYGPAYEDFYMEVPAGTASERPDGWAFPALFKTPGGKWALVTESALDDTYCGSHLAQDSPGGVYRIKFPDPKEGLGVGKTQPESTLPWTMPWRVVIVGDQAGRILESDLVLDLSPPSTIATTNWIKPGRAAWSWWSKSDSPKHAEDLNAFTDLAAEMGWEYALVDANWDRMETGTIEDVLAHAKAKNVGLFFWYNSGGPHNDVTEAPRDRMFTREIRRKELEQLKAWGVKGVKVDFWHSDKQDRIAQYRDILKDAADFQLMVNYHGSTIPRGWSREFPNLIGMEAVFGAEQYKFRDFYPAKAAWHNTVLPFTRNVAGPMDFTPVTFTDAKYPHRTTNAHELALSIIFETPVQHFADSVESYRGLPERVKTFLKQVPTAWDETRVLSGEPGGQLVIARRDRGVWYVGGINGHDTPSTVRVALDFLKDGQWLGQVITDGDTDRAFSGLQMDVPQQPGMVRNIPMRARGGFVMRFERSLHDLAGKGLAQHDFLYCGEWDTRRPAQTMAILRGGKVVWSYDIPNAQEYGDCTMLPNGNIVFSRKSGASEITPDKRIVWNYEAPKGTEIHTSQPIGHGRVLIMQNGNPAKAMIIETATNKVLKELVLPTRRPDGVHGQFRHIRLTDADTFLVAHLDLGKVVEYDQDGKELWSVDAPSAWAAVRLPNGNTLISGNQHGYVREVNRFGQIVWGLEKDDLPGIPLHTVQEVTRLANGNTLINNWAGSRPRSEWPNVVQLIELTPDKKIVWALRDWETLGPASSTQLLDQKGYR
jgi:alpha-glucosidase